MYFFALDNFIAQLRRYVHVATLARHVVGRRAAVNGAKLKVLYQRAVTLLRHLDSYRILHVRREFNDFADRLANRGVDNALTQKNAG